MKKNKKINAINSQEDEDASAYPIYPEEEDIYQKLTRVDEQDLDKDDNTQEPQVKTNDWHDTEFEPDAKREELDVPGSELDDKEELIGEEDEENNYYSIGGDNHNNLEEEKEDGGTY